MLLNLLSYLTLSCSWDLLKGNVSRNSHRSLYSLVESFLLTLFHDGLIALLSLVFLLIWHSSIATMGLDLLVQS